MGNQTRGVGTARPQRRVKEGIVMAKDVNFGVRGHTSRPFSAPYVCVILTSLNFQFLHLKWGWRIAPTPQSCSCKAPGVESVLPEGQVIPFCPARELGCGSQGTDQALTGFTLGRCIFQKDPSGAGQGDQSRGCAEIQAGSE